MEQVGHENTNSFTIASVVYNVNLRPTFVFKNYLPIDLECQAQGTSHEYQVGPGLRVSMPTIEPDHSTLIVKVGVRGFGVLLHALLTPRSNTHLRCTRCS